MLKAPINQFQSSAQNVHLRNGLIMNIRINSIVILFTDIYPYIKSNFEKIALIKYIKYHAVMFE